MLDHNASDKQLSRRRFMQVSSLLALGLAYQKPVIETLHPKAALGQYGQHNPGDGGGGDGGGGDGGGDQGGDQGGNQNQPGAGQGQPWAPHIGS